MTRRNQILVIDSGKDHCSGVEYKVAYEAGREIAKQGAALITGGLGGVMEAASKGAADAGGLVIGIIPHDDMTLSNAYCDIVVATGMGFARDFITAYSADVIVIVGGGAGTLIEMAAAYQKKTPMVALKRSGGVADRFVDKYLDDRRIEKVHGEDSPYKVVI